MQTCHSHPHVAAHTEALGKDNSYSGTKFTLKNKSEITGGRRRVGLRAIQLREPRATPLRQATFQQVHLPCDAC